jgi:hypothetical protein
MAAVEWVVMAGYPDGSYREAGRPTVEGAFEALQAVTADRRTVAMFAVRADKVHGFMLIDTTQPGESDLVRVLDDGTLVLVREPRSDSAVDDPTR